MKRSFSDLKIFGAHNKTKFNVRLTESPFQLKDREKLQIISIHIVWSISLSNVKEYIIFITPNGFQKYHWKYLKANQ